MIGLPRPGTTHLVNLLVADSRFRSLPLWESYEPVPGPDDPVGVVGVDPRWTRCQAAWEAMQAGAPLVAAMHPMDPDPRRRDRLIAPDFAYTPELVARERRRTLLPGPRPDPHYAYMKTVLADPSSGTDPANDGCSSRPSISNRSGRS